MLLKLSNLEYKYMYLHTSATVYESITSFSESHRILDSFDPGL